MFRAGDNLLDSKSMPSPGLLLNALNMATFQIGPSGWKEVGIGSSQCEYVRIYRASPDIAVSSQQPAPMVPKEDQPCGVARLNLAEQYWLKLDGRWIDSEKNSGLADGFVYEIISKAEFETDLHFDLWKELPVSYRPIRQWFKRKQRRIRQWNMAITCGSVAAVFECLERTEGTDSWWFVAAMVFGIHVCATVAELLVSMNRGNRN